MPFKVDLFWARTAQVSERGGASVVVNNPNDLAEIKAHLEAQDFYEFLTTDREYSDVKWSFSPILTEQDNALPDSPEPEPDVS